MQIGAVASPRLWDKWPQAEAFLEPARKMGGFDSVLDDDEELFAVLDGNELVACATAWLSSEKYVEVKLVGGRDRKRWLPNLDEVIGAAARGAGATRLVAFGRRGWLRELKRLGWERLSEDADGFCAYSREL